MSHASRHETEFSISQPSFHRKKFPSKLPPFTHNECAWSAQRSVAAIPSTKKLTVYRTQQFSGPRRRKPAVRLLNRAIKDRIDEEHNVIQKLVADADARAHLMLACGMAIEPFSVWNDLNHAYTTTNYKPEDLKPWVDLSEFIKLHLLFQVALDNGGYSFTARVRPDLEAKWKADHRNPMDRIKRLTGRELAAQGLAPLEYCFIVETRTKGGSRTGLHLHGFLLAQDPLIATRFKVAMEQAIGVHPKGRAAAGVKPKSGVEVMVEPAYDMLDGSKWGRGRWPGYLAKHATRWDARFKRRVFFSRTATQTARDFWALLREEPLD